MTKREEIHGAMVANNLRIEELRKENIELRKQDILLSDDKQWYSEQREIITRRVNRKKVKTEHLIGRTHWNEDFTDEDTGDIITIERSEVVRMDGKWL